MHIAEGYLPPLHAAAYALVSLPPLALGVARLRGTLATRRDRRMVVGAAAGFTFVLSALKLPSVTGSCSHPTGLGLGAVLVGPAEMTVVGFAVLLFQALFLAHGGLTTLGANLFSMAVVGGHVAFGVHWAARRAGLSSAVAWFLSAALADLATYVTTALQLAWAFPDPVSGFRGAALAFLSLFALTQLPLAIMEGLLTATVARALERSAPAHSMDTPAEGAKT